MLSEKGLKGWQYLWLYFAGVEDDVIEKSSRDVLETFRSFWTKNRAGDIDDMLKDQEIALPGAMRLSTYRVNLRCGNDGPTLHCPFSLE